MNGSAQEGVFPTHRVAPECSGFDISEASSKQSFLSLAHEGIHSHLYLLLPAAVCFPLPSICCIQPADQAS